MTKLYRLRFRQGESEFDLEGDKRFVLSTYQELKETLGLAAPSRPVLVGETKAVRGPALKTAVGKSASPREFIDRYGLKRHMDIVLAFGYFLERMRNLKSFTGADINTCYYESKMEPSNTSQMIINNIKKGFIMQSHKAGSKKGYTLTRTGEEFVHGSFKVGKAK
jgi:hypothetical protein